MTFFQFQINGINIPPPRDWKDINVLATFDNEAVQANISTDAFSFVNEGAQILREHVENGKSGGVGIFEGLPFSMAAKDDNNSLLVFTGFMDFDTYEEISPVEVKCGVRKLNGMNSLAERAEATTYGFLNTKGLFPEKEFQNVNYVVEKEINALEIIMIIITLFQMIKELIDSIKRLIERIADIVRAATPDATTPIVIPNVGQIIAAIILIIIDIVFIVLLSIAITELVQQLIETFISPIRKHKASYMRALLEKPINYFGYNFVSDIDELDQVVFLPSAPTDGEPIKIGLPRAADFGYFVGDMFEMNIRKYYAKIAIIGNDVHFRAKNDPFWIQQSTYILPDVLDEMIEYNTEELKANRLIEFQTDLADDHTIDNFRGTVYEVITEPISSTNEDMILIKGLDRISIPAALGSRKNQLNDLELALKELALFIDGLINAFGGSSSEAKKIDQRVGMLKVSNPVHRVSKLIPFIGGEIPKNPRDILGAKALYDKYINEKSFVANGFSAQKRVFKGRRIPFGFSDFIKLINNSYFVTQSGEPGKVNSIEWNLASDTAVADFEIEQIYTKNLKETNIEPS